MGWQPDPGSQLQDAQAMFDSTMSAASIAAKVNELQKAAGFSAPLLNPEGKGTSFITLTGEAQPAIFTSLSLAQFSQSISGY